MAKQAREDVEKLLNSIKPLLRIAGVPKQQINVAKGPKYNVNHYTNAFDWLHDFILSKEFENFKKAYALRPPEVWVNYDIIGVEGLPEQKVLDDAKIELQKRWRQKRPRMFGANRHVKTKDHYDEY